MKNTAILLLVLLAINTFAQDSSPDVYAQLKLHYDNAEYEQCTAMAAEITAFIGNRQDTVAVSSYFYLGEAWYQTGALSNAIHSFENARAVLESLGMAKTSEYANALYNLAYLHFLNGNYQEAAKYADGLVDAYREFYPADDDDFVTCVLYAADILIQADQLKNAENLLTQTLRQQGRTTLNRSRLLNKLGDLYSYTGQYSRATRSLHDALAIAEEQGGEKSDEYINAAVNTGILYMNRGKYPEAEEIFEVALAKISPDDIAFTALQNNQALVYQSLGQLDRAETTLRSVAATDSAQLGSNHPDFAITLSNLGLVRADQGMYEDAKAFATRALQILEANGDAGTLAQASMLNNLAKIYQLEGNPGDAVPLLKQSADLFKEILGKRSPEYATALYNLGVSTWQDGDAKAGYKLLQQSADIRRRTLGKNHPKYGESMLKIAEYQWHRKAIRQSRKAFSEVFDNYYFQIDETFPVLTEEEKTQFYYRNIRDAFDKFNALAVSSAKDHPELSRDVYDYTINTKAVIMLATEKVRASILGSGDSTLISQFESWQSAREQIARLYSMDQAHPSLDSLAQHATTLEKELNRQSAVFAKELSRRRYASGEVQQALNAGEAAVEIIRFRDYDPANGGRFTDKIIYAFLIVTKDTPVPHLIVLDNGSDIESKYFRYYRNAVRYQIDDDNSYEVFVQPLVTWLRSQNIKRFYVSPDGVYNQINIAALMDPSTGKYVMEEFDIRLVTNTRELIEQQEQIRKRDDQSSILIGFPAYNLGGEVHNDVRLSGLVRGGGNRVWRGGLMRYVSGEEGIAPLPGTETEVKKIAGLLQEKATVYLEDRASERVAKAVENPGILHIATHGYFLEDVSTANESGYISSPLMNAGLMLAGAENFLRTGLSLNEAGDDGILTAFEAMNLKLDGTRLVVLSACETALGNIKNGEGVYGLQRAFKIAGAQSIIMSLWSVDDEATQELMTTFYEALETMDDQHEAFRYAQQKVKEKYPSPFYWGGFVMVGL